MGKPLGGILCRDVMTSKMSDMEDGASLPAKRSRSSLLKNEEMITTEGSGDENVSSNCFEMKLVPL